MIKIGGFIISLFLIVIIFLQVPQESVGLSSFSTGLGSPSFTQRLLKIITATCIVLYFLVALQLNLLNN